MLWALRQVAEKKVTPGKLLQNNSEKLNQFSSEQFPFHLSKQPSFFTWTARTIVEAKNRKFLSMRTPEVKTRTIKP